ncbi:MAG: hypothetical protein ISP24_03525 [Rickettsiales bacterium]|nr:hypothetical protein [Rickettsiales bacterium]
MLQLIIKDDEIMKDDDNKNFYDLLTAVKNSDANLLDSLLSKMDYSSKQDILKKQFNAHDREITKTLGLAGHMLITFAAIKSSLLVFKTLIGHGANPKLENGKGQTAK